jgi:hypothetical protein
MESIQGRVREACAALIEAEKRMDRQAARLPRLGALAVLNDWPNQGTILATTSQVLREYLAVATRPVAVNGLGLGVDDALANVTAFRGRMRLLDASPGRRRACLGPRLRALIATYDCMGQ